MPNYTADRIEVGRLGRWIIEASFERGDISFGGGLMLLRRIDKHSGGLHSATNATGCVPRRGMLKQCMYDLCMVFQASAASGRSAVASIASSRAWNTELKMPISNIKLCAISATIICNTHRVLRITRCIKLSSSPLALLLWRVQPKFSTRLS